MLIKSFRADDARQALALVKDELGDDAVVLDTRTVRASRFFGLASRDMVEVMAAVDEEQEDELPPVQPLAVESLPQGETTAEQLRALRDELRQLRKLLGPGEGELAPDEDMPSVRILKECGISPDILPREALETVRDREGLAGLLTELMARYTAPCSGPSGSQPVTGPQIVAFVGPTGVGKTTTLAKLAARYALQEGRKVALVTCDTFRIGGVEQIRVYARILNVPLEVVTSPQDMTAAIEKHADADVILIDTIGRSQKNAVQLGELNALLAPANPTEVYLVVPASSSPALQADVVKNFAVMSPSRLVLSKTDESDSLGCIVSLPVETGLPISCITTGQNVPDDIQMAEPRALANLAVGVAR